MLDDLKEIIAIPSVEADSIDENAPFGANVKAALDWFLKKAREYGLNTHYGKGYYGWAEIGPDGAPIIGIPVHLDVVPAGGGWSVPPFSATVKGDRVYGRGVADDKGAAVVMLKLLKNLSTDGVYLNHRVRIIAGCNEETGSRCMKEYVKNEEIPAVSVVPDGAFPVINSEKGILHTDAVVPCDSVFRESILKLFGGERANVVPGEATAIIKYGSNAYRFLFGENAVNNAPLSPTFYDIIVGCGLTPTDFSLSVGKDGIAITAYGTAGHASTPEKCDSAIRKLFVILAAALDSSATIRKLSEFITQDNLPKAIGAYACDAKSGNTTGNLGVINYDGACLNLSFDFRLPISVQKETATEALFNALPVGSSIKEVSFSPNLYFPPSSPLVSTLLSVYRNVTGDEGAMPVQIGGGTYARSLPNAVAFGIEFPGSENNMHSADESIELSHLNMLYDIYREAVLSLDKIDF